MSQASFFRWRKQYAGLGILELRELRQLRDENRKLKGLVADLSLDRTILEDALKKSEVGAAAGRRELGAGGVPAPRAACL